MGSCIITERAPAGGNTKWKCKYCNYNGFSSYTQVEAHLLQIKSKGVETCAKVTFEMLAEMRKEVQRCKELVKRAKKNCIYAYNSILK
jgi:organic hydroperoxide reductase OsmC/OhrA